LVGKLVWYGCYGSNLNRKRFFCYIKGGKPEFADKIFPGCADDSAPKGDRIIDIPYRLYFSKEVESWSGGAVAFIESKKTDVRTFGRAYLITCEQFIDVVRQENGYEPGDANFTVDIKSAYANEQSFLNPDDPTKPVNPDDPKWYGRIINLGELEGIPILTFTAEWPDDDIVPNSPARSYLKTIADGIRDTYQLSHYQIIDYFISKKGIEGVLDDKTIHEWIM